MSMKEILLDGKEIRSRADLYRSLKAQLNSDHFTGNNLDALYDILTEEKERVQVRIVRPEALRASLGDYLDRLMRVLLDSAKMAEDSADDGK